MGEISKKVQERKLKLYGHVMRGEEGRRGKRMMDVQGRRRNVRLKRGRMDII